MKPIGEIYLEKEFPQEFLRNLDDFGKLLVERGLFFSPSRTRPFLEYLEKNKMLLPIIRMRGPKKLKVIEKTNGDGKKTRFYEGLGSNESYEGKIEERTRLNITAPAYLRRMKLDEFEFPDGSSFIPWQEDFNDEYQLIEIYYHPFQIQSVHYAKKILEFPIQLWNLKNQKKWTANFISSIEKLERKEFFSQRLFLGYLNSLNRILPFLIDISDIYLPDIRSKFVLKPPDPMSPYEIDQKHLKWFEFKNTYDIKSKLTEYGISIEELNRIRDSLIAQMRGLDPLEDWSLLVQQIRFEKIQRLKGSAFLAQDFFEITEILKLVIEDVTGEPQFEADEVFDASHGSWKVNIYGRRIRGRDREVLESLLTEYGINPRPWLLLIVEGKTEFEFYHELSNQRIFPMQAYWIELFTLGGVDRPSKAIESLARYTVAPRIAKVSESGFVRMRHEPSKLFIIVDREGDFAQPQAAQNIKNKLLGGIIRHFSSPVPEDKLREYLDQMVRIKIRNTTFDWDLFTDSEILQALKMQASHYSSVCSLAESDISQCRVSDSRLDDLFENATLPPLRLKKSEFGRDLAKIVAPNLKSKTQQSKVIKEELEEIAEFSLESSYAIGF